MISVIKSFGFRCDNITFAVLLINSYIVNIQSGFVRIFITQQVSKVLVIIKLICGIVDIINYKVSELEEMAIVVNLSFLSSIVD